MTLRPRQAAAFDAVRTLVRAGKRRILVVAPTGFGKTETYLAIVHSALAKGRRVVVLASQEELLEQPSRKLDRVGQDHGILQADHWRRREGLPLQLASVQTLARRGTRPPADVLICDEAHLFVADTFAKVTGDYPKAVIVGFTATPRRLDGTGLDELFEEIVVVSTIEQEIADGYLVPVRTVAPFIPDLAGVGVSRGDFARGQLARFMETPAIVGNIVETWLREARGRSTIGFAADVAHSQRMVEAFRAAGVGAAHVDGTTPRSERARLLVDLDSGALPMLWNAQLLTLGVDVPRVAAIVMARPTLSEMVYIQEGGRGLRPHPESGKQDLLLLDHAGNCLRHGLLEWPREWSLKGRARRPKGDERAPGLRLPCPKCFSVMPASADVCACDAFFPKRPRIVLEVPGEMREVTMADRAGRFDPEMRATVLAKWIRDARNPKQPFAIFRRVFGVPVDHATAERARALAAERRTA